MLRFTKAFAEFIDKGFESRGDFAKHVGLDDTTLSKLMNGQNSPSADTIMRIKEATGWDFERTWQVVD